MSHEINMFCTLRPKPSTAARLKAVLLKLSESVRANEPGCLRYQVWEYQTADNGVAFVLIETWKNQGALDNHHGQEYLKNVDAVIADEKLLAKEQEIRYMRLAGGFMERRE